mgnify:CR=1 FL=1
MNLQDHIEYIRNRCIDAIAHGDEMNSAIFEDGHGLIMTFNEAIEIANEIDRLKAERGQLEKEKAELLDALSELYDNQNDAPIERHRERWEAAMAKAKTAIENAEKTLPL